MRYLPAFICVLALAAVQALYGGAMRPVFALPALLLVALAGLSASIFIFRRKGPSPDLAAALSILSFAGWLLWREMESSDSWLAGGYLRLTLGCLVVYLLFGSILTQPYPRLAFVAGILLMAMIQVGVAGWQSTHPHDGFPLPWMSEQLRIWYGPRFGREAHGFYLNRNHLVWMLNSAGFFALSLACWGRWTVAAKVLCLYVALMSFGGSILTASRGGFLSLVAGLAVFFFLGAMVLVAGARDRRGAASLVMLAVLLAITSMVFLVFKSSFAVQDRYGDLLDDTYRPAIFAVASRQFQLEPLWGTGAGTFRYYGRQFSELYTQHDDVYAHNDWAQLAGDFGFPAVALLVVAVGIHLANGLRCLAKVLRTRMATHSRPQSHAAALLIGALSCLAVYLVHSAFDFNMQIPANALLAAAVMGILAASGSEASRNRWQDLSGRVIACVAVLAGGWLLWAVGHSAKPEIYGLMAENALLNGHWQDAETLAGMGLAGGQRSPALEGLLGDSFLLRNRTMKSPAARWQNFLRASKELSQSIERAPMEWNTRLLLVRASAGLGLSQKAKDEAIGAIEINPGQSQAYLLYAQLFEEQGQLDDAAKLYRLFGNLPGSGQWPKKVEAVEKKKKEREERLKRLERE